MSTTYVHVEARLRVTTSPLAQLPLKVDSNVSTRLLAGSIMRYTNILESTIVLFAFAHREWPQEPLTIPKHLTISNGLLQVTTTTPCHLGGGNQQE
jgi:hypothetical protein